MKEYTVSPGKHSSRPLPSIFPIRLDGLSWRLRLGKGWQYRLPSNQSQWIKLCGVTKNPFRRDYIAVMLGGRYNPATGFEVTPYYNVRGVSYYPESKERPAWMQFYPVMVVDPDEDFFFEVDFSDEVTTSIEIGGEVVRHTIPNPGFGRCAFEVGLWFGGSVPASAEFSIFKERLKH